MNKTALQWLFKEWPILESQIPQQIKDKAFEMEKDQIEIAYNESFRLRDKPYSTSRKYYKETYE